MSKSERDEARIEAAVALGQTVKLSVYVLVVEHRHGTMTSLHITPKDRDAELLGYVTEWWEQEMREDLPSDDDIDSGEVDLIDAYFNQVSDETYHYSDNFLVVPLSLLIKEQEQ